MLKKTITYEDYDGNKCTEELYFNLSKAELIEMEVGIDGGLQNMLKRLAETEDKKEIMSLFKNIILKSYGIKSEDGKRFIKSDELSSEFAQSEAYSELFSSMILNTQEAIDFCNGVIPRDLRNTNTTPIPSKT